jgi:hypothetical protein
MTTLSGKSPPYSLFHLERGATNATPRAHDIHENRLNRYEIPDVKFQSEVN